MTTKTKSTRRQAVKNQVQSSLNGTGLKLLGEVITFRAPGPHTYAAVKQALTDSGLDVKVLRERLPRYAFARACKELEEGRVIDVLRDDPDDILFQFSKRFLTSDTTEGGDQYEYRKELKLTLSKSTGKISCKDADMEQKAQALLDEHMQKWTTSDVHGLTKRLFNLNADLMPLPDTEGVYFVPVTQQPFIAQASEFMTKLGGRVNRLPVPEGTQYGDLTVQQCVGDYLDSLVGDHAQAVEGLTLSSRPATIQEQADRINATRVKVEAYASYLAERKDQLLQAVEEARDRLQAKVVALAGDRKAQARLEALQDQSEGSPWTRVYDALTYEPQDLFQLCVKAGIGTPSLVAYRELDRLMTSAVEHGHAWSDEEGGFLRPQEGS